MRLRTAARTVVVALAVLGVGQAAPAWAGGIGDILSPAFGTACANQVGATSTGGATSAPSSLSGNALGLPLTGPLNQCGGADLRGGIEVVHVHDVNVHHIPVSVGAAGGKAESTTL